MYRWNRSAIAIAEQAANTKATKQQTNARLTERTWRLRAGFACAGETYSGRLEACRPSCTTCLGSLPTPGVAHMSLSSLELVPLGRFFKGDQKDNHTKWWVSPACLGAGCREGVAAAGVAGSKVAAAGTGAGLTRMFWTWTVDMA